MQDDHTTNEKSHQSILSTVNMANQKATAGMKEILLKFNDEDLFGLAVTVTQGLLKNKITTKEGAVEVILKYSPDELSILKRRAVTRELLFSYLHDNNITVVLPITKDKLIDKICSFWNIPTGGHDSPSISKATDARKDKSEINVMAQKFSEWFYSIMNQNECMGAEHFYPDAKLTLNLISNAQCVRDEITDPDAIVRALFKTKSEHNLYFNPNLDSEGVQGRIDPHGLVLILACGTLHSSNVCAGVFEQVFALSRDPFCDNNWKIKDTKLNLRSKSDIVKPPNLCDSDLTKNFLALPDC